MLRVDGATIKQIPSQKYDLIVSLYVEKQKALQVVEFAGLFIRSWRREGDFLPKPKNGLKSSS
ncbi:hypothetical protein [Paraburkholderia tropica]|uniref:hypothetical protein n=1 Tax=Paraburkholderia tropica TaxID=92647 RepID=UPI0011B82CA4|nr:hypothetical protein [Paraburkholderia tropica]